MRSDDGTPIVSVTIPEVKGMTTIYKIGPYQSVIVKNDFLNGWSVGALTRKGCYMLSYRKASKEQALEFVKEFLKSHQSLAKVEVIIIPPPPRDKSKKKP